MRMGWVARFGGGGECDQIVRRMFDWMRSWDIIWTARVGSRHLPTHAQSLVVVSERYTNVYRLASRSRSPRLSSGRLLPSHRWISCYEGLGA